MTAEQVAPWAVIFAVAVFMVWFVSTTATFAGELRRLAKTPERPKLGGPMSIGSVKKLTILPLVEGTAVSDSLRTESGVSYLVCADDVRILFDVGWNPRREHPSPLAQNMASLAVESSDLDAVVVSHCHPDHIGEFSRPRSARRRQSPHEETGFRELPLFLPSPAATFSQNVSVVDSPTRISTGVGTTGPLSQALWLMGTVLEQSLVVDVEGKGLVVIVGCGHPSVRRIVERAEDAFGRPAYGLIGGLHFPVTKSRVPFGLQKVLGTGKYPWQRIGPADVTACISFLQRKQLAVVGISSHDSCDWTIDEFRKAFGESFREVAVGLPITVQ